MRPVTASQTIGPFWHSLAEPAQADLTRFGAPGPKLTLTGRVFDGDGALVSDAGLEIWQATPRGSRGFPGWGRCATGPDGSFRFITIAPDPVEPCFSVAIVARGLVKPLWTRVYLHDPGNDPVLLAVPPARRATLIATEVKPGQGPGEWRWDVRLQGDGETVFLEFSAPPSHA